jgi:uncharacterized protein involved in outer membrane biogenesis
MKSFLRWTIRICVTLLCLTVLLALLAVLLKDIIAKSLAEKNLRDNTGMDAKIEKMEVGLMTPTVSLDGLKIYNTEQFGGGTFLDMPELRLEYVPGDIRDGKMHLKTMRLSLAEIHIVKDKDGRTNLEMLDKEVKKKSSGQKTKTNVPGVDFGGIDTLYLTVGKLKITDLNNSKNDREVNVGLKDEVGRNLKTEADVTAWFAGVVFKLYLREVAANPGQTDFLKLFQGGKRSKRNQ